MAEGSAAPATDKQALGREPAEAAQVPLEVRLERPLAEAAVRRRLAGRRGRRATMPEAEAAARATRRPEAAATLPVPSERR